jgi:hypothetical protein
MFVIVGNSGRIVTSANSTTWGEQNSTVGGNDLSSIVYENELFVSVGSNGTIITCSNGSTWAKQTTNTTSDFYRIVYRKGIFVVLENDGIYSSYNGWNWTLRSSELATKIIHGNNSFVAVGNSSKKIVTSSDDITWEVKSSNVANRYTSAYGNNLYVVAGNSPVVIATSPDGYNWTNQTHPLSISVHLLNVLYEKNTFIIIGDENICTCNSCTELEIRLLVLEKRLRSVESDPLIT